MTSEEQVMAEAMKLIGVNVNKLPSYHNKQNRKRLEEIQELTKDQVKEQARESSKRNHTSFSMREKLLKKLHERSKAANA